MPVSAPPRDRKINAPRGRVHGHVVDEDLIRRRAEQTRDFLRDAFDLQWSNVTGFRVAGGDGEDCGGFGVGDKQDALRSESERSGRLEGDGPFSHAVCETGGEDWRGKK